MKELRQYASRRSEKTFGLIQGPSRLRGDRLDTNISASYNKLLHAIIKTLYKITTKSRIKFAKTHLFEI